MTEKRNQSNPKSKQPAKQLWTRKKAAEYLGVSISKVRTLEGKELHRAKRKGVNYFEPEAVRSYASKMSKNPKADGKT